MRRAGLLLILVLLTGCGFTGDASRREGDWLHVNNLAEPGHLDPALDRVAVEGPVRHEGEAGGDRVRVEARRAVPAVIRDVHPATSST